MNNFNNNNNNSRRSRGGGGGGAVDSTSALGATIARQEWEVVVRNTNSGGNRDRVSRKNRTSKSKQKHHQQHDTSTTTSTSNRNTTASSTTTRESVKSSILSYVDTKKANASMIALIQGVTVYALCLFLPSFLSTLMTLNWNVLIRNQCTKYQSICKPLLYLPYINENQLFWNKNTLLFDENGQQLFGPDQEDMLVTFAPDTHVRYDVLIVILLTLGITCLRVLLVHLLVPNHMAPQQMEAIVRCKSVHLLSSDYKKSLTPKGEDRKVIDISEFIQHQNTTSNNNKKDKPPFPLLIPLSGADEEQKDGGPSAAVDNDETSNLGLSISDDVVVPQSNAVTSTSKSSLPSLAKSTSGGGFLPPSINDEEEPVGFEEDEEEVVVVQQKEETFTEKATAKESTPEVVDNKQEEKNIASENSNTAATKEDATAATTDVNTTTSPTPQKEEGFLLEITAPGTPPQSPKTNVVHEDLLAKLGYNDDFENKIYPPHVIDRNMVGDDSDTPMPWLRRRSSGASLAAAAAAAVQEEDEDDDVDLLVSSRPLSAIDDLAGVSAAGAGPSSSSRMFAAPRYATAVFRLLYCAVSAAMAFILFHNADFWPWYVGGHGKTTKCWDLSGNLAGQLDSDFDQSNSMLRTFFLVQSSYHFHSGAFHIFSVGLMWYMKRKAEKKKGGQKDNKKQLWVVRLWKTIYFRTLFQHALSLGWLCVSYAFSSLRRLGTIGMFALDISAAALHLLQTCINAPDHSVLRKPKVIQFVLVGLVLPSYVYFRFYVWPLVGYSVMTESDRWLAQLESTLVPGSAKWFRITLQVWMALWMGFHMIHFQRLLFHPHLQRIFATESPAKTENPQEGKVN